MKKKILSMFLALVMVFSVALPAQAAETETTAWEATDFTYGEISQDLYPADDTTAITKYEGVGLAGLSESGLTKLETNKDLVLPAKDAEGKDIVGVCASAFKGLGITSLTLPAEANEWVIGASAFQKNALTTVDLSNVVYVGGNAFNSNSLTSVKFNEDIWLIANAAFGKNALTSIEFPETTTHALNMDNMAFAINSLTTVKIPNNTEKLHKWVFLQNTGVETVPASGTTAEKKGGVVYMYTGSLSAWDEGLVNHLGNNSSNVQRLIYDGPVTETEGRTYASGTDTLAAVKAGTGVIVDVRAKEKTDNLYLTDSLKQPLFGPGVTDLKDQLAFDFFAFANANASLKDKDIYVLCNSGSRGADAATRLLLSAGYAMEDIITITNGAKDNDIIGAFTVRPTKTTGEDRTVTGEQAVAAVDNKEVAIIDVRAKEKFAVGHLKNSVNLPLFTIHPESGSNVPMKDYAGELAAAFTTYVTENKETLSAKDIYVVCNAGALGANNAAKLLYLAGYDLDKVYTITGGATDSVMKENFDFVTGAQAVSVIDDKENYLIIDVRAEDVHAAGHLKNSVNLPLFGEGNAPTTLEDEMAENFLAYVTNADNKVADKTVYILCNSGARGVVNAFALFEQAGLDMSKVKGISGGAKDETVKANFVVDEPEVFEITAKQAYKKLTYNGNVRIPAVTLTDNNGYKLIKDTDFTRTVYNAKGNKVDSPKAVGTYIIKIEFQGKYANNEPMEFTYSIVPKKVTNLKASLVPDNGYNDVKLTWTKSTGATGYYVYYKKSTTASYSTKYRKAVTGNTATINNLAAGVKYNFKVVPYFGNDKVTSVYATFINKTTLKKVAGVKVSRTGKNVKVSWTNINGETGYQISRSTNKTGTANIVTCSGANLKSKNITLVTAGKRYYKVRAYKVENGKKVYGPWSAVVYK